MVTSLWPKSTKLYILDNSIIDLEAGRTFQVSGLLRVAASSGANHVTFTAHKDGGLADGDGFYLYFSDAEAYKPNDDSGTLLRYVKISNLNKSGCISINASGIKLYNVKITSNQNNGGSYFTLSNNGWAIIRNCSFEKIVFKTSTDLRATPFEMKRNIFRGGYYSIYFNGLDNPGVNPRQIEENDFDASKQVYLFNMTGASNVPLGNNYWHGGSGNPPVPNVNKSGTTNVDINFNDPSAPLVNAPAGMGPDW